MPSPIAHTAAGYLIYRLYQPQVAQQEGEHRVLMSRLPLLAVTVFLSLLPDMDAVVGLLMGDFGRFHNNLTHSFTFGLLVSMLFGAVMWMRRVSKFMPWFVLSLICYGSHVIMDFFTIGRGVMLLWPFSSERFEAPVKLFYGLHWSNGWISISHLWTAVTELILIILVGCAAYVLTRARKSSSSMGRANT